MADECMNTSFDAATEATKRASMAFANFDDSSAQAVESLNQITAILRDNALDQAGFDIAYGFVAR